MSSSSTTKPTIYSYCSDDDAGELLQYLHTPFDSSDLKKKR